MTARILSFVLVLTALAAWAPQTAAQAVPFTNPGKHAGVVVGSPGARAREIYEVKFIAVDGAEIEPREVIWLEPGEYEITVRVFARDLIQPRGRSTRGGRASNRIELVVEAGKTYHVGALYDRSSPGAPFKPVLYRVSDTGDNL